MLTTSITTSIISHMLPKPQMLVPRATTVMGFIIVYQEYSPGNSNSSPAEQQHHVNNPGKISSSDDQHLHSTMGFFTTIRSSNLQIRFHYHPPNNETRTTIKELTASTKSQHSFFTKFEYRNCCIFLLQTKYFHAKTYVP